MIPRCSPTVALLALVVAVHSPARAQSQPTSQSTHVDAETLRTTIRKAVRRLARHAIPVEGDAQALLFPESIGAREAPVARIYGGSAGVLIFLENVARVLPDEHAGELADKVARGLLATRRKTDAGHLTWSSTPTEEGSASLYIGDAGVGQAFLTRARLRKDAAALATATEVGDALLARGRRDGDRLSWDRQVEVISGAAGTLLFLLDLGAETREERFLAGARAAGRWLVKEGVQEKGKDGNLLSWRWQMGGNATYLNFSHGTAGVAYALARVGLATGDEECARAAREGAAFVEHHAARNGDQLAWPVAPGSRTMLGGWCHGAPGTARLFLLLHAITGEERHLATALASARGIVARADAAQKVATRPAFPPSFCCGVAGVLDFFCDLHRTTGDAQHAAFARRTGAWLVAEAVADGDGVRWSQGATAHGARTPEYGLDLMLGTPGDAFALLRLLTLEEKEDPVRALPDRRIAR